MQTNNDKIILYRLLLLCLLVPVTAAVLFVGMPPGAQAWAGAALREGVKEAEGRIRTQPIMVALGKAPRQSAPSPQYTPPAAPPKDYFDPRSFLQPRKAVPAYTVLYYVEAQGIPTSVCDSRRIETWTFHMRFGNFPFYQHYQTQKTTSACGNVTDTWTIDAGTWFRYQSKGRKWITRNLDHQVTPGMTILFNWNPVGDATDDNVVDVSDFAILQSSFGLCSTSWDYQEVADFEKDWCVDVEDFGLLRNNFGQAGDPLEKEN